MALGTRTPTAGQLVHADINQDGQINVADVLLLQKRLLQGWLGIRPPTRVAVAPLPRNPATWVDWFLSPAQALPNNSGQVYYVHNDQLGTPQVLTDESGTTVWTATYDPFGMATVNEDPDGDGNLVTLNVRLPGQYYDQETGLHYNAARFYDPSTGRYLTSDPIGLQGGPNTYVYVDGNPLRWTDPLGLAKCTCNPPRGGGFRINGEKICKYSCRCTDCNGQVKYITIEQSAGSGSNAQCIGQATDNIAGTTQYFSFSFDTNSIIDRTLNLGVPNELMDKVDRMCDGCVSNN
ncbi:MAG TPA: hypothetical protein ENJ13_03300 [Chromatiales bacterium]|nr:hypothetical protein [Chromatiales bacterium]